MSHVNGIAVSPVLAAFEIDTVTKIFTTVAVLLLVESQSLTFELL
jgi:hypothetical protein